MHQTAHRGEQTLSYKKTPVSDEDEAFLNKISVKLPSVGGDVKMGDVYN